MHIRVINVCSLLLTSPVLQYHCFKFLEKLCLGILVWKLDKFIVIPDDPDIVKKKEMLKQLIAELSYLVHCPLGCHQVVRGPKEHY